MLGMQAPATGEEAHLTAAGDGKLEFTFVRGKTAVTSVCALYPLKLVIPAPTQTTGCFVENRVSRDCAWVYMIGHGGGMVSGDRSRIVCRVGENCSAVLTTQASTKIYHQLSNKFSTQYLDVTVGAGGLLALVPDPVVPYARSRYIQKQTFRVCGFNTGNPGSIAVVDWITCGRRASGEIWDMEHLESTNDVYKDEDLVVHDSLRLSVLDGSFLSVRQRMEPFMCMANVILLGPRVSKVSKQVLAAIAERQSERIHRPICESNTASGRMKRGRLTCLSLPRSFCFQTSRPLCTHCM